MKLGAGYYPEMNSVTLNVILLDVYLSSRNPLGYRHHNLRFAPFHDNPDCVRDGDDAVLRRSKPASLDCHLHLRKYADCAMLVIVGVLIVNGRLFVDLPF